MGQVIAGHKTRLRGDFKYEGIMNDDEATAFLVELESLMLKYWISKVDICWVPHWAMERKVTPHQPPGDKCELI